MAQIQRLVSSRDDEGRDRSAAGPGQGRQGSRQTTEAEEAAASSGGSGCQHWSQIQIPVSFVLSHPACGDVTQETVSGTGSQAHGPGQKRVGCLLCSSVMATGNDTHATRRGDCGPSTQGPKRGRGLLGAGGADPGGPLYHAGVFRKSGGCWGGHGPLASEPEGRAGSPVLLRDKDQCAELHASDQAREEAFLGRVPVVNPLRAPGLERHFQSRPELRPEVKQHTRQGGGIRVAALPLTWRLRWACGLWPHRRTSCNSRGRLWDAPPVSDLPHLEEPQLSEQQPPLGPGSLLWGDVPTFAASQAIFLGLVLGSLSVGCLLVTRPIGPSSFHGLPISPPPTGLPSTTQCVVTAGPEGKVLAPGQR